MQKHDGSFFSHIIYSSLKQNKQMYFAIYNNRCQIEARHENNAQHSDHYFTFAYVREELLYKFATTTE